MAEYEEYLVNEVTISDSILKKKIVFFTLQNTVTSSDVAKVCRNFLFFIPEVPNILDQIKSCRIKHSFITSLSSATSSINSYNLITKLINTVLFLQDKILCKPICLRAELNLFSPICLDLELKSKI